jgi:hypothetical protein
MDQPTMLRFTRRVGRPFGRRTGLECHATAERFRVKQDLGFSFNGKPKAPASDRVGNDDD